MLSDDVPNLHSKGTNSELGHRKTSSPHRVSRKAYNRWFVAYTLIKNPSLRKDHASEVNVYDEFEITKEEF
uniref:Uncharacterized protein n=1 Tax=Amphimedon queenslandica TaxID=400682 RepID=A0A1X7UTL1_AMPQE